MDWIDRVKGLVGSHAHQADPQRVADEVLLELQNKVEQAERAVVTHGASATELRSRATEAALLAARRKTQATVALKAGDDDLARRALLDCEELTRQAQEATRLAEAEEEQGRVLRAHVSALQLERLQLQARRNEAAARGDVALLDKSLADVVSGIDARSRSFDELEAQSTRLELEAAAHREVAKGTSASGPQAPPSAPSSDLDEQLRELKQQLEVADKEEGPAAKPDSSNPPSA